MPALIQFVDSISASPTVRLDINDSAAWFCTNFSAPLPRLRRSESGNSMRDGGVVGSATYENRTLEIELTLVNTSTEDAAATEMQKLWRELDRPTNYLRYQREGMTKPVFFRLFRSDAADFEELWTTPIARNITLEILAEPTAIGLPETLGPFTVSANPIAASNPTYVDVTDVLGDVSTPVVYWDTTSSNYGGRTIAAWATTNPRHLFQQAESMVLSGGTTNPGGAASATFSGTGTTNYVQTTFTVPTMTTRLTWTPSGANGACAGTWRVLVFATLAAGTSGYSIRGVVGTQVGPTVTVPNSTSRIMFDLGLFNFGDSKDALAGYSTSLSSLNPLPLELQAAGTTATTLRWDCAVLLPAGGQTETVGVTTTLADVGSRAIIDSVGEAVGYASVAGNPITGTATRVSGGKVLGGFPSLQPGVTNRVYVLSSLDVSTGVMAVTSTTSVNLAYWPRYLYIRPVST